MWKLKTRSSSQTLPKYWSSTCTRADLGFRRASRRSCLLDTTRAAKYWLVEHLDEEVDGLEARELVVVDVHAEREKEPGVAPIHKLVRAPLHEVGELGLALRHYFVAFDLRACRGARAEQGRRKHAARLGAGRGAGRGMRTWIACFSESSYGTYHFDRRVLPCRFCRRRNRICAEAHVRLAPPAAVELTPRRKAGASTEAADLGVGRHTPPLHTVLTNACFSTSCVRYMLVRAGSIPSPKHPWIQQPLASPVLPFNRLHVRRPGHGRALPVPQTSVHSL